MPDMLIIYSHRNSDYTLDILSADVWVASAKNYRDADLVAQQLAETDALTTAIVTTMVHDGLTTCASCANCHGPHHIQNCPQIRIVLLAPPHCPQCGDVMDAPAEQCPACREWSAPVVDVEFAPVGWAA